MEQISVQIFPSTLIVIKPISIRIRSYLIGNLKFVVQKIFPSQISLSPAISLDELLEAINVKRITWYLNPEISDQFSYDSLIQKLDG